MKPTGVVSVLFVAAVLMFAPTVLAAPNGVYNGETKGLTELKLKVKNNRVVMFKSSVYASCGYSNFIINFVFPPSGRKGASIPIRGNGKFRAVFRSSPDTPWKDDKRTLTGRAKGGKITGTMKVRGLCTADTTYTARK